MLAARAGGGSNASSLSNEKVPMPSLLVRLLRPPLAGVVLLTAVVLVGALPGRAAAELSAIEREAIEAAFTRADTNGDGKLTREESQRFPEIAARFDALDQDRDGFLSLAEFAVGATPPVKP